MCRDSFKVKQVFLPRGGDPTPKRYRPFRPYIIKACFAYFALPPRQKVLVTTLDRPPSIDRSNQLYIKCNICEFNIFYFYLYNKVEVHLPLYFIYV